MSEQNNRSFGCKDKLMKATEAGCYYCESIFPPNLITEFVPERYEEFETPICPLCGIDSVLPFDPVLDISLEIFSQKLSKWNKESF